jgi:hypothetical protein
VLKKVTGPKLKKKQCTGKKLHNERLHSLYNSVNIFSTIKSRKCKWRAMWHILGGGGGRKRLSVGKLQAKKLIGKSSRRPECTHIGS